MLTLTTNPFDLNVILGKLQQIDPSMTLFRGFGVTNFYSEKHKYSITPIVNLEQDELIFELVVPNGFVDNQVFAGSPDQCCDWLRENLSNIVAASDFSGRTGTREDYLISIGEDPALADSFEPTDESDDSDELELERASQVDRPNML